MKYGYARVSKTDQRLNLQTDALKKYGVDKIYTEKISGRKRKPVLSKLLKKLKSGDSLVIWKLDRLGRIAKDLMEFKQEIEDMKVFLVSLTESLDTSNPMGKCAFQMVCCFSEMERNIISERTSAGLISARAKGHLGGRRPGLTGKARKQAKKAGALYNQNLIEQRYTVDEMRKMVGVSKATFYKYLKHENVALKSQN